MENTTIDFLPIIQYALVIIGIVLAGAAAWLSKKGADFLKEKTNIELNDEARAVLTAAIGNAVKFAEAKLNQEVSRLDPKVTVESPAVAQAVNYVIANTPDALQRLGVTQEQLAQKILAQLPK